MTSKALPSAILFGAVVLGASPASAATQFPEARLYIEYNASGNDLGFHVFLDAEDWKSVEIRNPAGVKIFEVEGSDAYAELGMTELFFEGAEPALDEFPLDELLALFPAGVYTFQGLTVDGGRLRSRVVLSHAVPAAPEVSADVSEDEVVIRWQPVESAPPGFPVQRVEIVGYQVIVDPLQVTLPQTANQLTLPPEFVEALGDGTHPFEVLAIDASGNQTITEGTFTID